MSRTGLACVVIGVHLIAACGGSPPRTTIASVGSAGDVLAESRAGWVAAYNAADAATLAGYFADDAVLLPPGEVPVAGAAAIGPYVETFFEGEHAVLEVLDGQVRYTADLAVETAVYSVRSGGGEDASVRMGKFVMAWQQQPDGSWKIVWDMWNGNDDG